MAKYTLSIEGHIDQIRTGGRVETESSGGF